MIAATRERRQNAGAKMSQLLQNLEDVDDFYKSQYGGFNEEEDDAAYHSPVHSESDQFDSDFDSSDESDEPVEDDETVVRQEKLEKKAAVKKTYKEPSYINKVSTPKPKSDKTDIAAMRRTKSYDDCTMVDKKLRASTLRKSVMSEKSREAAKRQKDRRRPYSRREGLRLSQAEMLAEAKETEKINLSSLESYEKYEEEMERKRKAKMTKKRKIVGPKLTYLSTAMPILNSTEEEKYERTFIILGEECDNAKEVLLPSPTHAAMVKRKNHFCPVTGLPAKYFDPVTRTPYATLEAFRTIRSAYNAHLRHLGGGNTLSTWLSQNYLCELKA